MLLTAAALCLAMNVYHESRGENVAGQYAVALVTMNRAEHDRKNVCKVVLKPKQFSWTTGLVKGKALKLKGEPKDKQSWATAQSVAKVVLSGRMYDFTSGSTHYHTLAVRPVWRKSMLATKVVGQHIFYKLA